MVEREPSQHMIDQIRKRIKPYDIFYVPKHQGNSSKYVFRKPVPYVGDALELIIRGYGLVEYLPEGKVVTTESEAAKEIKRIIEELKGEG